MLSLAREGKIIPNPRGTRVLEADDRLLCFGKIDEHAGPAAAGRPEEAHAQAPDARGPEVRPS